MDFNQLINLEILGPTPKYIAVGIQVLLALLLGGLVGLDRETKQKAAGLKTNMLICIGATLYTTISMSNVMSATGVVMDPNRVGAQIVSGIGFLGAGAIMQSRGGIMGLTTAATIWVVASIGFTIGSGHILSATIFTVTVLIVLKLIHPINSWMEQKKDYKNFHIEVLSMGSAKKTLNEIIFAEKIELDEIYEEDSNFGKNRKILHVFLKAHPRAVERMLHAIRDAITVEKVNHRKVDSPKEELIEVIEGSNKRT
jgi:putative Mg2+ transporter-C (MgtC) family protein